MKNCSKCNIQKPLSEFYKNVNRKDKNGLTALHYAAFYNMDGVIKKLIDSGADIDSIDKSKRTPLMVAAKNGSVESVVELLEKGANKDLKDNSKKTAYLYALENSKGREIGVSEKCEFIMTLLGPDKEEEKEMWKGTTKTDVDKFDIFFEQPFDWSVCPVCLSFVERKDGCLFMSHICKKDSEYYNEALFNKYSYRGHLGENMIEWCTACGRVSKSHKHYKLASYNEEKPEFAKIKENIEQALLRGTAAYFDNKNCQDFGGGGLEEKVARFRRLREYSLELNDDIGKKTHQEAMNELIQEVWNAPLQRSKKPAQIIEKKEWNIPLKNFPSPKRNQTNKKEEMKNYPNIPMVGEKPTEKKAGDCMCIIGGEDDIKTYSFDHKDRKNGIDHADMCICKEDLTTAIQQINTNFGDLERPIGFCWFHKCKATLYPEEIKGIVPDEVYEEYRKKFNKHMGEKKGGSRRNKTRKGKKNQMGGSKYSILHPVDLSKVTCWSPPKMKAKK